MKIKLIALLGVLITAHGLQAGKLRLYVKNNSKLVDGNNQARVWSYFEQSCGVLEKCDWNNANTSAGTKVNLRLNEWKSAGTCCSPSYAISQNEIKSMNGKTAHKDASKVIIRGRYQPTPYQSFSISLETAVGYGSPTNPIGRSEQNPIIFPGYWAAEGSAAYSSPQNFTSLPIPPVRKFGGKNYKFIPFFKDWAPGYDPVNQRGNIPFEDLALPPSGVYKTQAQLDQQAAAQQADIPTLFNAGSLGTITNQTAMSYQVKDSGLPSMAGNGATTNVATQWPTTKQKFSDLADSSQTITFVPTNATSGFPIFTFTFNESAQTITISRSGESNIAAATWIINFTPILNFAQQSLNMPGAKSWSLDFTINNDANIIIDQLKVDFYRYKADAGTQTIKSEKTSYAFLPNTTNKFIDDKSHPSSTTDQQISGGLCSTRTQILLSTNPTCAATPIKK